MSKESNKRSIVKGITWRVIATTTTILIVYLFFDRLDLAIAAGFVESILKVGLYWAHERAWFQIKWGIKKNVPFNLWFTGIPLSGKTTIANAVFKELEKLNIPLERIDSKEVRNTVPNIGYSKEDRNRHMHRLGYLINLLQKNNISTIASFVSPYKESRRTIRKMVKENIIVYVKTNLETCKERDKESKYQKAINGIYKNFSEIDDIYEEPQRAEITINTDETSIEEATEIIITYIKRKYLR